MRSATLVCLVGSLLSTASGAWAQDVADGTGYFRGPAASVVTGDGTGYYRGVTPSAPPPPRGPVATSPTGLIPYDRSVYWSLGFPAWNWLGAPLMGSRLFPYGYGMPRAPFYGRGHLLDSSMHRRSRRSTMRRFNGYRPS